MGKVRVGIIGVGNCASSFVQGVHYYRNASEKELIPGLMHTNLGGYHISDIEFSAAIDIDKNKVGKDLGEAIYAKPNCTYEFTRVPKLGVRVVRGMTHDGLGYYLSQIIEAGCGFVNCIPVFIAREKYWQERFIKRGLPMIGDDIKSQVGATIVHRILTRLFRERGVRLERTSQLNVGGNTDFFNMLERSRLESKKISKTNAVTSQLDYDIGADNVHIGPSDYVAWLTDRKWAYIRLEGKTFGDVPLNVELKLEVWDSPNSAGVVIDAVRCVKLALDNKLSGSLFGPASYFMKSPPEQYTDVEAREKTEEFIATYGGKAVEVSGNGKRPAKRTLARAPEPSTDGKSAAAGKPRIKLRSGKKTAK
jgi:myo-inositol-1-phosphate synthase